MDNKKVSLLVLSFIIVSVGILGAGSATISNVYTTPAYPNFTSSLVTIHATITPDINTSISYVNLYYQINGDTQIQNSTSFYGPFSNGSAGIYYANPQNGVLVQYRIKSVDNTSNSSWYPSSTTWLNYTYDESAPIVNISGAPSNFLVNKTGVMASVQCSDNISGCNISTYSLVSSGVTATTDCSTLNYVGAPSTLTVASQEYICARAVDNAGNTGYSNPVLFNVFNTIQSAINAASSGQIINISAGTYPEAFQITKPLSLIGSGSSSVVIDATSLSSGYGSPKSVIYIPTNNVIIRGISIQGSTSNTAISRAIKSVGNNVTLNDITIDSMHGSGIDLNTANNTRLNNVQVTNSLNGFGVIAVNSNNISFANIITGNNGWGGVSVQTKNGNSSNISFSGTFDATDNFPFLIEQDPSSGLYYPATNVQIPSSLQYIVYDFRAPDNYKQWYYFATLSNAETFAQAIVASASYSNVLIYNVAQTNYYVESGMKIQDAINAATSGDAINVGAGIYNEGITINKPLTLLGAQAGVDARTRSGSSGESIINGNGSANIAITANGITVDGFKLMGPSNQGTAALYMMGSYSNEVIQNNIIENPGRAASFNTNNTIFRQNLVNGTGSPGDGFQENSGSVNNVTIVNNSFTGVASSNADITIIGPGSLIIISGNVGVGDSTLIALFNTINALITYNNVTNAQGSAVYVGGNDTNIIINGNQIKDGLFSAIKIANSFGDGPSSNIAIINNNLTNNSYGINVATSAVNSNEIVQVHQNTIMNNNLYDLTNGAAGFVNATDNWWGTVNGVVIATLISGNVNYTPWAYDANLDLDHVIPTISILYPLNNTLYNYSITQLNYSASDSPSGLYACWYSLDNGTTNYTVTCNQNITGLISTEGINNWTVYAVDKSGNLNSAVVHFTQDTTPPFVNITSPINGTSTDYMGLITVTTDATDLNGVKNVTLTLSNSTGIVLQNQQMSLGTSGYEYPLFLGSLPADNYTLTVNATDNAGNVNSTTSKFILTNNVAQIGDVITINGQVSAATGGNVSFVLPVTVRGNGTIKFSMDNIMNNGTIVLTPSGMYAVISNGTQSAVVGTGINFTGATPLTLTDNNLTTPNIQSSVTLSLTIPGNNTIPSGTYSINYYIENA